jgi:hypothetical protein
MCERFVELCVCRRSPDYFSPARPHFALILRIAERVTERVSLGIRLAAQRELIHLADGRATLPD